NRRRSLRLRRGDVKAQLSYTTLTARADRPIGTQATLRLTAHGASGLPRRCVGGNRAARGRRRSTVCNCTVYGRGRFALGFPKRGLQNSFVKSMPQRRGFALKTNPPGENSALQRTALKLRCQATTDHPSP